MAGSRGLFRKRLCRAPLSSRTFLFDLGVKDQMSTRMRLYISNLEVKYSNGKHQVLQFTISIKTTIENYIRHRHGPEVGAAAQPWTPPPVQRRTFRYLSLPPTTSGSTGCLSAVSIWWHSNDTLTTRLLFTLSRIQPLVLAWIRICNCIQVLFPNHGFGDARSRIIVGCSSEMPFVPRTSPQPVINVSSICS